MVNLGNHNDFTVVVNVATLGLIVGLTDLMRKAYTHDSLTMVNLGFEQTLK